MACCVLFHRNESGEDNGNATVPGTGTVNNRLMKKLLIFNDTLILSAKLLLFPGIGNPHLWGFKW